MRTLILALLLLLLAGAPALARDAQQQRYEFIQELYNRHDKRIADYLVNEIEGFLRAWPDSRYAGDCYFLLGSTLMENGRKAESVMVLLKGLAMHPDTDRKTDMLDLARRMTSEARELRRDRTKLLAYMENRVSEDTPSARYVSLLEFSATLESQPVLKWFAHEATWFSHVNPEYVRIDTLLKQQATGYLRLGMEREAEATWLKLTVLAPASPLVPMASFERGVLLYKELKAMDQALAVFMDVARSYPESEAAPTALFLSGEIKEQKKKDYNGAVVDYRHVADVYRNSEYAIESLLRMAEINVKRLENHESAIATLRRIAEEYPQDPRAREALISVGDVYANRVKDYPKAAEAYAAVTEAYPNDASAPQLLLEAGSILEKKNKDYAGAISYYEQVLEEYAETKAADTARKRIEKARKKL